MNKISKEQVLNKAYRLAYFLHQDKGIAIPIVAAATLKLNVAMAVQSKRLYYVPVGRFSRGESRRTDGIRNKALFSDLHLLQRLVYVESEPYERQKERTAQVAPPGVHAAGDPASEEDLLVYFIKHLVRITTKRNAFYVTLGVSRLLHSYSTLETMEIYNAVIGEPERVKDDYYYRSRKAVLMHEMSRRFGELIRACRQRRGEERFETQPGSSELRSLVRECLRLFTPWDTQCPVPRDFDPFRSVIASLTSQSSADENRIEVNRIHAILHPACFERLIAAFGYCPPEKRIELPRFFLDQSDDQAPPQQRNAPTDLSAEELAEINNMLDEQAGRRRRSSPSAAIRIMVDGVERGRLIPAEQSSVSFSAGEDAEIIEVKTTDSSGDLLLATHMLTSFGKDAHEATVSIRLEGGQHLSLSITRSTIETNGPGNLLVKFGYQETNPRRALRLWWDRLRLRRDATHGGLFGASISPRQVLAATLTVVVISIASYLVFIRLRPRATRINPPSPVVATEAPNEVSEPAEHPTPAQIPQEPKHDKSTAIAKATPLPAISAPPAVGEEDADTGATRSGNAVANLKLGDVKKIYIDIRGDAALDRLRSNFVESLGSSSVVSSASNTDEADAALKIVVSKVTDVQGKQQIEASARLVNARGTVLWPKAGARRYSGEIANVVSEIVKDLSTEIKLASGIQ